MKKAAGKAAVVRPDIIDVEQVGALSTMDPSQDKAIAGFIVNMVDLGTVRDFIRSIATFVKQGTALEATAVDTLARARLMAPPVDAATDEAVQVFIRESAAMKKQVETHWGITSTVHGFHKALVARRSRATTPLEEAATIGNNLHNRYVAAERTRVAIEQERVRREAEALAQQKRDLETARLEADAIKLEERSVSLSAREEQFVEFMARSGDGIGAARFAGYCDVAIASTRLLKTPKIVAAIDARHAAASLRSQAASMKAAPLEVEVEEVVANISRASGARDRTTWTAEILDEAAFIEAAIAGKYGIPRDLLRIDPVALNNYAVSMNERLNLWPGVRAKKTTRVV
jgi:hypothetical protein